MMYIWYTQVKTACKVVNFIGNQYVCSCTLPKQNDTYE